jgi:hypothetical protein
MEPVEKPVEVAQARAGNLNRQHLGTIQLVVAEHRPRCLRVIPPGVVGGALDPADDPLGIGSFGAAESLDRLLDALDRV